MEGNGGAARREIAALKAGSTQGASGVVPETGRDYPPDEWAGRDRPAIAP
jgi:hypothetical protein